jgi:hypothetical protein
MIPFGHDGGGPQFRPACRMRRSFTGLTHPNGSFVTLRWRGLDSNFQYAGAVNWLSPLLCRRKLGRVGAPSPEAAIRAGGAHSNRLCGAKGPFSPTQCRTTSVVASGPSEAPSANHSSSASPSGSSANFAETEVLLEVLRSEGCHRAPPTKENAHALSNLPSSRVVWRPTT